VLCRYAPRSLTQHAADITSLQLGAVSLESSEVRTKKREWGFWTEFLAPAVDPCSYRLAPKGARGRPPILELRLVSLNRSRRLADEWARQRLNRACNNYCKQAHKPPSAKRLPHLLHQSLHCCRQLCTNPEDNGASTRTLPVCCTHTHPTAQCFRLAAPPTWLHSCSRPPSRPRFWGSCSAHKARDMSLSCGVWSNPTYGNYLVPRMSLPTADLTTLA
jgi:hypothetical protein